MMRRTGRFGRVPSAWLPWITLAALAIGVYVLSIFIGRTLFPLGSANQDDAMYRYFADLLRDGRIRLSPADDAFRPWASGYSGGRIVMIYEPPWPTVLALGDLLFGTKRAAVGITAAAGVVLIALLGRELFGQWRYGLVAASCLALTPIFAFQSGLTLSYNFQVALTLGALLLAIKGMRLDSTVLMAGAGFVWGVAFWARPYDGIVLAGALGLWFVFGGSRSPRAVVRRLAAVAAGAVLPLALFAWYLTITLGSPFHTHFAVLGDGNRPGFGSRGITPYAEAHFGARDGLGATGANLKWMLGWMFGGALALPLLVWGGRRAFVRARSATMLLIVFAIGLIAGYTAFWSPHAIVYGWSGVQHFGPFYHLALVIPIALFTAAGVVELWERRRVLGVASFAVLVVATGVGLAPKVRLNRSVTDDFEDRAAALDALEVDRGVLFLEGRIDYGWDGLVPFLQNAPDLDNRYVVAQDNGPGNFDVLDRFPDRTPITFHAIFDEDEPFSVRYVPRRLSVDEGASTRILEVTDAEGGHRIVAYARLDDGRTYEQLLDDASTAGARRSVDWRLGARDDPAPTDVRLNATGWLELGVRFENRVSTNIEDDHRIIYAYRVHEGKVQVLQPGRALRLIPGTETTIHDVTEVLADRTPVKNG